MYKLVRLLLVAVLFAALGPALATASENGQGYIGEKECYSCHKVAKNSYRENIHGKVFATASEGSLEARGCEACHGPGAAHKEVVDREEEGVPMEIEGFERGEGTPAERSSKCLACHENDMVELWRGSMHDMAGVSCESCHDIHAPDMKVGMEPCFECHPQRRAQIQRSSHMPLREGLMDCYDCHNPHGGKGPHLLKAATVNESCYECHEEKRGPFVWEHAPARDNCALCHDPHGSNFDSLVKIKPPYLCQQCHMANYHPSSLYEAGNLADGSSPARQLVGKACLNCHSQVHGTNHPSGSRLTR